LLAVGVCLRLGWGVDSPKAAAVSLAAAAGIGVTAVVPFPYLWRAVVGALAGLIVAVIGLGHGGPLALLSEGSWGGWRLVAAIVLPAALLFRAHYRAYERGRFLLAGAFLLSVPFLAQEVGLAFDSGSRLGQLGALLTLLAWLSSLVALLGAPTTAATAWCAELLTVISALDLGLRQFSHPYIEGMGPYAHALTALAFVASASPVALGLFQVLAAVHCADARRVDVHRPSAPSTPAIRDSSE
jgi:hypothetical protein